MEHSQKKIIELTDEEIEDLNDAISECGIEVEFGVDREDPAIAYHITPGSTFRNRINPNTRIEDCWKLARAFR